MNSYYNKINDIIFTKEKNIYNKYNTIFNNDLFKNKLFTTKKSTIMILFIFSSLIYFYIDNNLNVNRLLNQWNIKTKYFVEIENTKMVYGMFLIGTQLIISFKGTSSLTDVLNDLTLIQLKEHQIPGLVHKGFHDLIFGNDIHNTILESILDIMDSNNIKTIYLTGHSLGASLSSLFYAYLKNKLTCKIKLITFGCPKIGNRTFSDYISTEDNLRIVNGNDLIPKIPKSIWYLLYYTHPKNTSVKIGYKDTLFFSITDHYLDCYYNTIKNSPNII